MQFQQTTVRTTTISPSVSIKQFVTPQQMLQRLISTDIPKCQCTDSFEQQILLQKLIAEYKIEIATRTQQLVDAERLLQIRDRLHMQMQQLRKERQSLEMNIAHELNGLETEYHLRMTGLRSQSGGAGEQAQLIHIKQTNNKLRLRLKDLLDYISRMETYNQRLQMSRTVLPPRMEPTTDHLYSRTVINDKVLTRLAEQDEYTRRMQDRVRRMQQQSLNKVRLQQEQIHRRNLDRVNQIRLATSMNPKTYISTSQQPILGQSRGFYQNKVFFPDQGMYDGTR